MEEGVDGVEIIITTDGGISRPRNYKDRVKSYWDDAEF